MKDNNIKSDEIKSLARSFSIEKSEAFQSMVTNGLTMTQAQEIAKRYYPVNRAFPLFLAAAIAHTSNEEARILLVKNLYEEHGSGVLRESHVHIFEDFIKATGLNPDDYVNAPKGSVEAKLVDAYNKFCFDGKQHTALGVLYAFEELFSPISEAIAQGLRKSQVLPEDDFKFFPIHGIVDIEHASNLRSSLLAVISSENEWAETLEATRIGAETLFNLFDSIAKVK